MGTLLGLQGIAFYIATSVTLFCREFLTQLQMWLGPNAILSLTREGYKATDIDFKDVFEVLRYPGFLKLAWKFLGFGTGEIMRSISLHLTGSSHSIS